jgi:hypothetical protein
VCAGVHDSVEGVGTGVGAGVGADGARQGEREWWGYGRHSEREGAGMADIPELRSGICIISEGYGMAWHDLLINLRPVPPQTRPPKKNMS